MKRRDRLLFQPDSTIVDLEAQHDFEWGRHRVVWGGGYRNGRDHVLDGLLSGFRPTDRDLTWYNIFAQDEFRLTDSVVVTAGLKAEHNDYTGLEYLPNLRLAWKPSANRLLWVAASRAVRAPSRLDRDVTVPIAPAFFLGGPNFQSEVAKVIELGFRSQPSRSLSYSLTLFHHDWDRLRSGTTLPLMLENKIEGSAYGIEGWAAWQVTPGWRLTGGLATLRKHLTLKPGSTDPVGVDNVTLANDPKFQWSLRSAFDLNERHQIDIMVRRTGALTVAAVSPYTAIDARYGWKIRPDVELSLTVQNLADPWHPEFRTSALAPNEIPRSVLLAVRWTH
jgi:iron complex outermembrane receptor protein